MDITLSQILELSETRKADRQKIAQLVSDVCAEHQIDHSWTREGFVEGYPKAHVIRIDAGEGLKVSVEIDGDSVQPNTWVLAWHIDVNSDTRLANSFGDINPFHFQKCTEVAWNTFGLLDHLRSKFALIAAGKAFDEDRKAAAIKENGTAAERSARFAEWRKEMLEEKSHG
ncbi:MAG: hypothetical protein RIA09_16010 [Hoeflea sp.]|jgi:hypothetical protein|uniref:hypothetical protein n=1 Tax=Hoeflea sp. TaxID=1940281 RepID=UPI0032EB174A